LVAAVGLGLGASGRIGDWIVGQAVGALRGGRAAANDSQIGKRRVRGIGVVRGGLGRLYLLLLGVVEEGVDPRDAAHNRGGVLCGRVRSVLGVDREGSEESGEGDGGDPTERHGSGYLL
jgi:hypothetical protein